MQISSNPGTLDMWVYVPVRLAAAIAVYSESIRAEPEAEGDA